MVVIVVVLVSSHLEGLGSNAFQIYDMGLASFLVLLCLGVIFAGFYYFSLGFILVGIRGGKFCDLTLCHHVFFLAADGIIYISSLDLALFSGFI